MQTIGNAPQIITQASLQPPPAAALPVSPLEPACEQGEPFDEGAPKSRGASKSARSRGKRRSLGLPPFALFAASVVAAAAASLGVIKLFGAAESQVRTQDRFQVATRDIEATPLPVWIRTDLLAQVERLARLPDTLNTLEPDLAGELRDAFSLHPWVREVVEVRITHPNTIRVKLEYREPVAVVNTGRSLDAIDRDGVRLTTASELPDPALYLTITGVRSTPTGPVGTKWEDPTIAAAVAVANVVSPQHRTLGLTAIDMSGFRTSGAGQSAIYLLTEQGTRVKWGRPPDVDYPGEVPVQDKLDRLTRYTADNGSLDQPAGPYEIDVTHWQEISLRPRNQSPSRSR